MQKKSLIDLLKIKRFGPFFYTQFFGAFNDNVFKQALLTLATFGVVGISDVGMFNNIAVGLFILPFFLFSAFAGQIADKVDKAKLIQQIKLIEIALMVMAAIGFYYQNMTFLVIVLFLMGTQSAFFGPVKYGILPQHLKSNELVGGNALVEAGTFIAILLGSTAGALLIDAGSAYMPVLMATLIVIAAVGYLTAKFIPTAPSSAPNLIINWNLAAETAVLWRLAKKKRSVYLSILGNAWFWFFGSVLLVQLPEYTREFLHGGPQVVAVIMTEFSLSIAIGSIICDKLSRNHVEIGLVPIGAFGMTLFGILLYFALPGKLAPESLYSAAEFLSDPTYWPVLFSVAGLGASGGLFIVPLYALIQKRSEESERSRIIAANNIYNAAFMVLASLFSMLVLALGGSISELFLGVAILNCFVTLFIFKQVPEFMLRFISWVFINLIWRLKIKGEEHIPEEGAAVLVCNHVSFADAVILMGMSPRPVRFVMYHKIFNVPVLNWIFKLSNAIPIAPKHEDEALMNQAFDDIKHALDRGELVCIFPEGKITADGEINPFKPGVERILESNPVKVVPMALCGMWGSFFSRVTGRAMAPRTLPGKLWQHIELRIGAAIAPAEASASALQTHVSQLRGEQK